MTTRSNNFKVFVFERKFVALKLQWLKFNPTNKNVRLPFGDRSCCIFSTLSLSLHFAL